MEAELIRDQRGGAAVVKFVDMSDEELLRLFWAFPEAREAYLKRLAEQNFSKSG